jgi:7-keto-8-aminopelargonate synthetase-like enzyme
VTESLFSMDGDRAPLRELVELKDRFGAWLMVDEAHATGVLGPTRRGLAEACGVVGRIEVHMGTLGKAIGAAGGFIAGARELIELLVNRARSFVFSTAPVPAAVAAARAGIDLVDSETGATLARLLWDRINQLRANMADLGWEIPNDPSPILPLVVGDERTTVGLATDLRAAGFLVPAIRYPTVARGAARLRVTLSAAHRAEDVIRLCDALGRLATPHGR